MPNFHRVVITGIGAVTPIGNNIDEYLLSLQKGTNGVSGITLFDPVAVSYTHLTLPTICSV